MTRLELIRLLLGQAKQNGFPLRRWYTATLGLPWQSSRHAAEMLADQRRYYALLFSHEFAQFFWKEGESLTIAVDQQSFQRSMRDGSIRTVHRKAYIRRSIRPGAWRYHLRQLAMAEEPLRYMRRYVRVEDQLEEPEPPVRLAG